MVNESVLQPCWRGNVDIAPLIELFRGQDDFDIFCRQDGYLEDLQFLPFNSRDSTPPFPPDIIPNATSLLDLNQIPLWMFADMIWNLQTTSPKTNLLFHKFLQNSPLLPNNSHATSLLLTAPESNILITCQNHSTHSTLLARSLHPPSLLTPSLSIKRESPSPPPQSNPFDSSVQFVGQFIPIVSPQRISAREASCSQFDAKLESPGRNNVKVRRERRVQSLLPDIARRRKAELENPFASQTGPIRSRQGSIVASQDGSRQGSLVPSQERSRQGSILSERTSTTREASIVPSMLEIQTKEVVKQTVIAALRLQSISSSDGDYKALINQSVSAAMFALRGKLRQGRNVGMGEIGSIVESLLEIFLS